MYSAAVSARKAPEPMFATGYVNENVTQAEGSPICVDVAFTSGATAYDGQAVNDDQCVAGAIAKPANANANLFTGVAEQAMARGSFKRYIAFGPTKARVRNTSALNSINLAVGDLLVQVPGQDYFTPVYQAVAAGAAVTVANHCAARVVVRKATTIAASTTSTQVPVWVYPPRAPIPQTWEINLSGTLANNGGANSAVGHFLGIARGYGEIVRAGMGLITCGTAGDVTLDVLINAVSIFTTNPKINNDGTDPMHTLNATAAAAVGTGGSFGTINTAANKIAPNDRITATLTYANTPAGMVSLNAQVEANLW